MDKKLFNFWIEREFSFISYDEIFITFKKKKTRDSKQVQSFIKRGW